MQRNDASFRTFLDLSCADKCFEHILARTMMFDRNAISSLFLPAFESAMETVVERMAVLNISKVELVALSAVLLLDPCMAFPTVINF
ncbi:unnamed protein product [Gongylonema pulchrum]|uniref:NR LBD domain-containing protein n=1 Tax=Gongylonema pulchrum TaxID=637853 RepID=A0A183D7S4_9BILA|nr:unnamed protein product [Gongylonema pulchrum]